VSDEGTTAVETVDEGADGHRTRLPMPVARIDDPHLGASTRHPARVEGIVALSFVIGIGGVVAFGAAYWQDATPWIYGVSLGIGLFFLGFGLTAWGKYLMPAGPFVEERHELRSSDEERQAMAAAVIERGDVVVRRRWLLGGLLGGGLGLFGIVAMFPLLRSLGPLPGNTFEVTAWKKDALLVDTNGRPIHVDSVETGGIVSAVFPKGYEPGGRRSTDTLQQVNQTVVIRLQDTDVTTAPGRESWGPMGYVAFSKLCTHLGCPVGLYEQQLQYLVCPCHQSMFYVPDGCKVIFGPAPRPLPQLPLYIDDQGFLRAQAGYDQPVGPGFWERTT
jgi:ubiquinol-cytochrome c reductase iron-sulfur subunit